MGHPPITTQSTMSFSVAELKALISAAYPALPTVYNMRFEPAVVNAAAPGKVATAALVITWANVTVDPATPVPATQAPAPAAVKPVAPVQPVKPAAPQGRPPQRPTLNLNHGAGGVPGSRK